MRYVLTIIGAGMFTAYFWYCALTPSTWHLIDPVNLIFHEAGHAITIFFPDLITAFMGSGFQILIPSIFIIYFYKRRELLSVYLLMLWLGQNFITVSEYIRDAIPMNLSLLGGDYATHDWNFILGKLGILQQSEIIADTTCFIGYVIMAVCTIQIFILLHHETDTRKSKSLI
jgi:hypothetical protein